VDTGEQMTFDYKEGDTVLFYLYVNHILTKSIGTITQVGNLDVYIHRHGNVYVRNKVGIEHATIAETVLYKLEQ
jgi:hypothetical protein